MSNKITITCVCSPSLGISRSATNENLTITKRIVYFEVYKVLHKDMYKCLDEEQMVEQGQGIFVPVNQRLPFRIKLEDDVKGDVKMKVCSSEGCKIYTSTSGSNEVDADFTMNVGNGLRQRNLFFRAEKSGKYAICLEYEHEGKPYSEAIEFEVFEIEGAIHVPEYGRFTYKLPQLSENSRWGDSIENGTVTAQDEADKQKIKVHWQEGDKVGRLPILIDDNFCWYIGVWITGIEVTASKFIKATKFALNFDGEVNGYKIKRVETAGTLTLEELKSVGFNKPVISTALYWEAEILLKPSHHKSLELLEIGFVQNLEIEKFRGIYGENKDIIVTPFYEDKTLEGQTFLDVDDTIYSTEKNLKYYLHTPDFRSKPTGQVRLPPLPKQFKIEGNDTPNFGIPGEIRDKSNKKHKLQSFEGKLIFDLWIVAHTIDKCSDDDCNYTALYKAQWSVEMKEDYPFKTVNDEKPKKVELFGQKKNKLPNLLGKSCKVTAPKNWGEKLKDGNCPTILDSVPYNTAVNSIKFTIL